MTHASRGTGPTLHEFPNHARQTKVVSSFLGATSPTHEFHILMPHAHTVTPLSVQLAAQMNLPRIACVALLLNLTMTTPLARFQQLQESHGRQQVHQQPSINAAQPLR
jgi:hypothetical protein